MKYTPQSIGNTQFDLRKIQIRKRTDLINDIGSIDITQPTDLAVDISPTGDIVWNSFSGYSRYRVIVKKNSDGSEVINATVKGTSYTPSFDASTGYDIQVKTARKFLNPASSTITSVVIDGLTSLKQNGSNQLQVSVSGTGGFVSSVTWSSSNESIATVDNTGRVTYVSGAVGATVDITATSDQDATKSDSVTLTIVEESTYTPQTNQTGDELFLNEFYAATQGDHLEVLASESELPDPDTLYDLEQYMINGELWFFDGDHEARGWVNMGPVWTDKTGWNNGNVDLSIHNPVGVEKEQINGEWRVTKIDMQKIRSEGQYFGDEIWDGNVLAGTLPPSWGNLIECKYINLKQNFMVGGIPDTIQPGSKLEWLSLGGQEGEITTDENSLGDNTDHQGIKGGKEFEERNKFSGPLPTSLSNAVNIYVFECRRQYMTEGLPPEWSGLTNLKWIYVELQKGSVLFGGSLPPEWGAGGIDPVTIDLSGSTDKNGDLLPPDRDPLYTGNHSFTGGVPQSWQDNWSRLTNIWLRGNPIGGKIPDFVNCVSVRNYNYANCLFTSPTDGFLLPASIFAAGNNSELTTVNLGGNNLSGQLRDTIPAITTPNARSSYDVISVLDFTRFGISGPLPGWVQQMSRIQQLRLWFNNFSSGFPVIFAESNIMRLFNITDMNDGTARDLPDVNWGTGLYQIYMEANAYTGSFPATWSSLSDQVDNRGIWLFYANANDLEGEIPAWLGKIYGGDFGPLTSGSLTVGRKYQIKEYIAGDDFTNVGASSNATGVEFIATGTTPTSWTNKSKLGFLKLERLRLYDNRFTYKDIIPNYADIKAAVDNAATYGRIGSANGEVGINPQKPFNVAAESISGTGSATIDLSSKHIANNVYEWQVKSGTDWVAVTGETGMATDTLITSTSGVYRLRITNPTDLPELEESLSKEITITIT